MNKFLLPIVLMVFISLSCGKSSDDIKEEKEKAIEQSADSSNKRTIQELVTKYHAVINWDTLHPYTYLFQKMFIEENRLMSFEGDIKDVTKYGTVYILKVRHFGKWHKRNYEAEISVSKDIFQDIEKHLSSGDYGDIGCFIIKVSRIVSMNPVLTSEYESEGEESYSYLTYDFEERLIIFKGDLVDFYFRQ